jgi:hypothetical protein
MQRTGSACHGCCLRSRRAMLRRSLILFSLGDFALFPMNLVFPPMQASRGGVRPRPLLLSALDSPVRAAQVARVRAARARACRVLASVSGSSRRAFHRFWPASGSSVSVSRALGRAHQGFGRVSSALARASPSLGACPLRLGACPLRLRACEPRIVPRAFTLEQPAGFPEPLFHAFPRIQPVT